MNVRYAIAALLLCLSGHAAGQVNPDFWCTPKTAATPNGEGSAMVWKARLDGGWAAWWCPVILAGGQPGFRGYYWAGLYGYGWSKMPAASERVEGALVPEEQARIEVFAAAASASNEVDRCKQRMLRRDACVALRTTAFGAGYPAVDTAASAAARCGSVQNCTALPPPVEVWRVTGSGTLYNLTADGRRGSIIPGRVAPSNGLCNCSNPIPYTAAGVTSTFCKLDAGPANEITMCRKVAS